MTSWNQSGLIMGLQILLSFLMQYSLYLMYV